jgi:hypothetical protein
VVERRSGQRRNVERRQHAPGDAIDVTRLEHENLCRQVDEVLRMLRRIEAEAQRQLLRIERIETAIVGQRESA